jgi:uncharacterized protein
MPSHTRQSDRDRCRLIIHKALAVVKPQFKLNFQDGVHGVSHWSRVWFHGWHLSKSLDLNPAILAWFAYLHDSQRFNDHKDPAHGPRATDFALKLRQEGLINELNSSEFECLCEAMRLHSNGHTQGDSTLQACWDADRLDLWRVGIKPESKYLCTPHAQKASVQKRANRMAQNARPLAW